MKITKKILLLIFVSIALSSTLYLWKWAKGSYENQQLQQQLEELYQGGAQEDQDKVPGSSSEGREILPEYRQLYEQNKDIVGWLNLGVFSTPVVQKDNAYYLTHDFYGQENDHGQIFLDERNSPELTDDNTILYGHNIPSDKSMFHVLMNFKNPEFVKQHPIIYLNSLYEKNQYAVAAVYLVSTRPEHGEVFDYINYLNFSSKDAKEEYLSQIRQRSLIDAGVELNLEDKLLTLSTCSYEFSDARLVVVARKLRQGETPADFGKDVSRRENPLMPPIWTELYG